MLLINSENRSRRNSAVLSEQSDGIKERSWALARSTSKQLPATLTCLTLYYDKLIKSPQVSYFKCRSTKTSHSVPQAWSVSSPAEQQVAYVEKWFRNINHSEESSWTRQISWRLNQSTLANFPGKHSADESSLFPLVQKVLLVLDGLKSTNISTMCSDVFVKLLS